jgi:hypothetical protein
MLYCTRQRIPSTTAARTPLRSLRASSVLTAVQQPWQAMASTGQGSISPVAVGFGNFIHHLENAPSPSFSSHLAGWKWITVALQDTVGNTCKFCCHFSLNFGIFSSLRTRSSTLCCNFTSDRLNGAWGVADIADCANAAIALASDGRVDGTRTAIRGGSAGGFTTLAALSNSEAQRAFAAGTSLYGISDLTRLAKAGTHKFEARYMDKLIGGTADEIPDVYAGRSPVNNAQNIRSALLVSFEKDILWGQR